MVNIAANTLKKEITELIRIIFMISLATEYSVPGTERNGLMQRTLKINGIYKLDGACTVP